MKQLKFAVLVLCASLASCATFDNACDAVMPTLVTTQAQLADVQRAIDSVERSGVRKRLLPEQRLAFDAAMGELRHGYAIATQSLALAASSCSKPNASGAVAMIVEGWRVVRSFFSLVGGGGTIQITDPIMFTEQ